MLIVVPQRVCHTHGIVWYGNHTSLSVWSQGIHYAVMVPYQYRTFSWCSNGNGTLTVV